jgi:hypothetical protein
VKTLFVKARQRVAYIFVAAILLAAMIPLTAKAYTCPCSIWPTNPTPTTVTNNDSSAVELGVKFRSDVAGSVTGIRFYKGPQNLGTHTGTLWSNTGLQMATATFSAESASGWQQVTFGSPVNVTANTTYVASYYAPVGRYSSNNNYFTANTGGDTPVHGLRGSTNGGNGVYKYGASGFPTSNYNNTNYWVDVIFSNTVVADTTAPTVTGTSPATNATNVPVADNVTATFSEDMNATTVNTNTVELRGPGNTLVPAAVTYNSGSRSAILDPSSDLAANTQYTATVKGGATDPRVKDVAGNALATNRVWSFTTATPVAPLDQGPGGPILVIKEDSNPYSKYLAEILRAEGFNSFASATSSSITPAGLAPYDVVILGEVPLTATQAGTLSTWVNGGGNLIAMRPDSDLNSLLGLTAQAGTLDNAYLLADAAAAPGAGIVNQTMQYHGSANKYSLDAGTSAVATLYSNSTTATSNPAVSMRGTGTGQAAAFSYDLAKSVIQTRQGNPAWAGQERDNSAPIRPNDLFYGAKIGDVQPDWIDLNKVSIPQADEQQRLLGNMISFMTQDKKPLPKLWYLPKGAKAAVVMVGDDHATANGTAGSFSALQAASPVGCSAANWECFRSTSLVYNNSPYTNAQAVTAESNGFDVGVHVSTNCSDWTPASLLSSLTNDINTFKQVYPGVNAQGTTRTHCIAWSDWSSQASVEASLGLRMDLNYYYWPGGWVQNRSGFMTGSGMPMRFTDTTGAMIDVFQQPSHLVNEAYTGTVNQTAAITSQLDRAIGAEGYYGAFGTHYDYSDNFDIQLMNAARDRNVPIVSGQQLLDWTDGRNASSMTNMTWNSTSGTLGFTATADARTNGMLRGMLPVAFGGKTLSSITRDGNSVSFSTETIKGITYALFPVQSGSFSAVYTTDNTAPTVTTTMPVNGATGVSPTANVTATFSEGMNPSTINSNTIELRDSGNALVASTISYDSANRVATIDPTAALTTGATYTATLKSGVTGVKDLAGNGLTTDTTWSFTVSSGFACPCSIFTTGTPTMLNANDPSAVELGFKFQSDVPGTITGIRFYKGPGGNNGTHTGTLWSSTGTQLATGTFVNETDSGWQQMTFAAPVAITANTTYVASYFAPTGFYSATPSGLSSQVTTAPLRALASSPTSSNGMYKYGGGFPDQTYNATNYWVDVVFTQ